MSWRVAPQKSRWPDRFALYVVLVGALLSVGMPATLLGRTITFAWNPSPAGAAAGYRIHYGLASGQYQWTLDAGHATNATLTLPDDGNTYYLAATAYNPAGVEGGYSNESVSAPVATPSVSFLVAAVLAAPAPVVLTAPALTAGQFTFTVNGVSGAGYIVQVSTNLVNWTPVLTNAAPFTFSAPRNPRVSRCFYRALAQ
jgi:hypothetical protein